MKLNKTLLALSIMIGASALHGATNKGLTGPTNPDLAALAKKWINKNTGLLSGYFNFYFENQSEYPVGLDYAAVTKGLDPKSKKFGEEYEQLKRPFILNENAHRKSKGRLGVLSESIFENQRHNSSNYVYWLS